jgi:hypothetical protein
MRESPYLAEISPRSGARDHVRSVHLDACDEFPFDTTRALEPAASGKEGVGRVPSIGAT